jgi:hypothetical protein
MKRIAVGQALLFLIRKYQTIGIDCEFIKKLYLSDIKTPEARELLEKLLAELNQDPDFSSNYIISFDPKTKNEDPSRRYFETHLAMQTLIQSDRNQSQGLNACDLNVDQLEALFQYVEKFLTFGPPMYRFSRTEFKPIENILAGTEFALQSIIRNKIRYQDFYDYQDFFDYLWDSEYADNMFKLKSGKFFPLFSEATRNILACLIKHAGISVVSSKEKGYALPFYSDYESVITTKKKSLGLEWKKDSGFDCNSCALGILKSYMPLPRDDMAFSELPSIYFRCPDRQSVVSNRTEDSQKKDSNLLCPVVSGPSGTMFAYLKIIVFLHEKRRLSLTKEEMPSLFRNCISILLSMSGGHSIGEFIEVLSLSCVKEKLCRAEPLSCVVNLDEITLFYSDNQEAYNQALKHTIEYNDALIRREHVFEKLAEYHLFKEIAELKLELKNWSGVCQDFLSKCIEEYFQYIEKFKLNSDEIYGLDTRQEIQVKREFIASLRPSTDQCKNYIASEFSIENSIASVIASDKLTSKILNAKLLSSKCSFFTSVLPPTTHLSSEQVGMPCNP